MWLDPLPLLSSLFIAQDDGGPNLGAAIGNGAATPGAGVNGATPPPAAGDGIAFMWILIIMLVVIVIWASFRQKREQKKRDAMMGSIRKRDKVQTIGGIIGSVVEIKGDTIVLKVDEASNTRMTFARSAVQQILNASPDREDDAQRTAVEEAGA